MEEPICQKNKQFKDSNGFEDNNEEIDFKFSHEHNSNHSAKSKSFEESILLDKLSQQFLSDLVHSNLTSVYHKSVKQYQKDVEVKQKSNISQLPDISNISSQINQSYLQVKQDKRIVLSAQHNHIVRQSDSSSSVCKEIQTKIKCKYLTNFIKISSFHQKEFEIVNCSEQLVCVRKIFSSNIFKLIFHFCCSLNTNIVDYELSFKQDYIQLKLKGEATQQSLKMFRRIQISIWKSQQLEISEEDSLKFFLQNQQIDQLQNHLKFIMNTTQRQNGIDLCVQYCNKYILELYQTFKLRYWNNKQLSQNGRILLEKQIFANSQIFSIFKQHFHKDQIKFVKRKNQIIKQLSISQCFDYLEVQQIYRLQISTVNTQLKPYSESLRIIQQVNDFSTASQKLKCLNQYYQTIQRCCKSYHGGKVTLQTMDQILPILIYTLLFSKVQNLYPNIKLVQIFVRQNLIYQADLKMIANIYASIQYISNCWNNN